MTLDVPDHAKKLISFSFLYESLCMCAVLNICIIATSLLRMLFAQDPALYFYSYAV